MGSEVLLLKKGKVISHFHDTDQIDQIKTLRTQILNSLDKIHGNSFLVTSANPYEGKTFTSINLGVSIAQEMHRTVLIVDCDLKDHSKTKHKQFAQDFFGLGTNKGLTDYLLGNAEIPDILLNPGIERLVIVPAGTTLPNSAELLSSPKMAALVDEPSAAEIVTPRLSKGPRNSGETREILLDTPLRPDQLNNRPCSSWL